MTTFGTDATREELRHQYSHRVPNADAVATLREIRQRFLDLAVFIDDRLPSCRERSLALTKLDECRMWACNAAVRGGEVRETLTINAPVTPKPTLVDDNSTGEVP